MKYTKGIKRVYWQDWKLGEVYYREGGTEPFQITFVHGPTHDQKGALYKCNYLNGPSNIVDTKRYLIKAELEGENSVSNELFQIKGEETYGFQLATNSQGKIVFEVKGTGEIRAVNKDQLEEVIPYTVAVNFIGSSNDYAYWAKEGDLKVGDLVYIDNTSTLAVVKEVNSKSRRANKWFTGSVFSVTKVIAGE